MNWVSIFFFLSNYLDDSAFQDLLIGKLDNVGAMNWMNMIGGTLEQHCTMIWDSLTMFIEKEVARETLAKGIFNCVKHSSNYMWSPENSEYENSENYLQLSQLHGIRVNCTS